jgi:uncharacterized protein YebE (UPF0316 family)
MSEKGQIVGPWTLLERIDEGGNGIVWLATGHGADRVALKVLKARRSELESYKRFVHRTP